MSAFDGEIADFLRGSGFGCMAESRGGMTVLWVEVPGGTPGGTSCGIWCGKRARRCIVPWPMAANRPEEAGEQARRVAELLNELSSENMRPIIITEDRWRSRQKMMQARLLAHLEVFVPMYARNCEVRKIDKETARAFLEENHSYGDAACRYRYGLYLKRYTGKKSEISRLASLARNDSEFNARNDSDDCIVHPGTLVAVATFSNARKWVKGEKTVRSYEWTRYASLPGVRINGGMGKALKAFIKDVLPDDIMSYADLEWSEGAAYEQLGFRLEGRKEPVLFCIDSQWHRSALKHQSGMWMTGVDMPSPARALYLQNLGSNKYRLKLTEYE